jgi:hypothetical protein
VRLSPPLAMPWWAVPWWATEWQSMMRREALLPRIGTCSARSARSARRRSRRRRRARAGSWRVTRRLLHFPAAAQSGGGCRGNPPCGGERASKLRTRAMKGRGDGAPTPPGRRCGRAWRLRPPPSLPARVASRGRLQRHLAEGGQAFEAGGVASREQQRFQRQSWCQSCRELWRAGPGLHTRMAVQWEQVKL